METYVKHNSGRLTEEVNAEEDSFQDMLLFLDLLTNLLTKDIIDCGIAEGTNSPIFDTCVKKKTQYTFIILFFFS